MATTHLLRSRSARRCRTRMTMVCATYEMGFARVGADPVVFMAEGRSVETAPPDPCFEAPRSEPSPRRRSSRLD